MEGAERIAFGLVKNLLFQQNLYARIVTCRKESINHIRNMKLSMPIINVHLLKCSFYFRGSLPLYLRAYITKIRCTFPWLNLLFFFKSSSLYHCSRPSAVGCSLGCLLRQGVFPLIGQHAAGLPVPQCVRTLPPGGSACALYSLAPESWRCAEARPPHIPHDRSPPVARKQ